MFTLGISVFGHCALFWQFNFLYAIFLWHFSGVAQIRLHTCTHKHTDTKHVCVYIHTYTLVANTHTLAANTHTHTRIFYFISVFVFVQLCNNHFCAANSFPLALVSLEVCTCVCACVYAQQSPANFVGFIYAQCATALHTSWRSRRTEMNFHGNFTKTNPPETSIYYTYPPISPAARTDFNLRSTHPLATPLSHRFLRLSA